MKRNYFILTITFLSLFYCNVMNSQAPTLWGLTTNGGSGYGSLFSITTGSTSFANQFNFIGYPGSGPQFMKLIQAPNGKLYGTTNIGGTSNLGVLFEYEPTSGSYSVLVNFTGSANGSNPQAALLYATNGKLYGLTRTGGTNNIGVLFEYDLSTSTYTKKVDMVAATGSQPFGALIQATNGKLYGVTRIGGTNNVGTLFEYDIAANTYTVKVNFLLATGSSPLGAPMQAANGKLYGSTQAGGASGAGVIYEYDIVGDVYTKKIDLLAANGSQPFSSLLQASNGKLYGTTNTGGTNGIGVIYEYDYSTNTYTKLYDMVTASGANPQGSLIQASNGKLYGLTRTGGLNNLGVFYEYDITGSTYTNKYDFSTANGTFPLGAVMQATNGSIYGVTSAGGASSAGVLFEYVIGTSTFTKKLDFNASSGGSPLGSLVHAANDKMYGLTSVGGSNNLGVIFEYNITSNTFSKTIDLSSVNGCQPAGSMIQATNGKLYGMTKIGGANNLGAIFEYDYTTNTYTKKIDLTVANGNTPYGALLQASNGLIYGLTNLGGSNNLGVLFEYDASSNTYTKKIDLAAAIGSNPFGSLIQASNGKLYGLTRTGGINGVGTVFEYVIATNTYSKVADLSTANGSFPHGSLVQAGNGKLYGLTQQGGANSVGVLFEFDVTTNTYTKLVDLSSANGQSPMGSLKLASNGKLYGLTQAGGTNNVGVIFEYDITGNSYTKKMDLSSSTGNGPTYTHLVEVCRVPTTPGAITSFNTLCQSTTGSQTFSIAPVGTASSYTWSFPAGATVVSGGTTNVASVNFSAVAAGVFTVGVQGVNSCGNSTMSVKSITIFASPSLTVNSGAICTGQSFTLSPSGAATYTFSSGSPVVSPTITSSYTVTGTSSDGCLSTVDAISNVTVNVLPSISVNSGSICFGTSFTMNPSGASTYTFSSGSPIVSPTTNASYSVTGTDGNGCVSAASAVSNVTVVSLPVIGVNSGAICSGAIFTMIPNGAFTYTFSSGSNTVSPLSNTNYSVTGTSSVGCISAAPAISSVTVNSLPIISVNSGSICLNQSFTMNPSGANTYTYSSGSSVVTPTGTSSYSVTGTSSLGCVSPTFAIATVTVAPLPNISVNSGTICFGTSFTINPSGAATYTYSSGSNIVSPTVSTIYTVTGTSALGCVSPTFAVSNVTVIALPVITVNSGAICLGAVFTMTPGGANTYTFSSGSNTVSPLANTNYSVTGTSSVGCVSSAPAVSSVTVNPLPNLSVNSGSICLNNSFTMTPSGAATYTYSSGSSVVTPTTTSSYSVSGTTSLGCVSNTFAVANVTVVPLPFISVNSGSMCATNNFTLVGSGASTYTYSGGSNVVSPATTTFYTVIGTSSVGCISSNTAIANVTVYARPFISVNSGSICSGNTFTMNSSGAATYTYSSGSNTVSPATTTLYTVIGTSSLGCLSTNTAIANVTVVPVPIITVNSGTICSGKIFTMTPGGAATYTFYNGTNTVSPVVNTSYSVTGTSSVGCISPTPAVSNVTVIALPNVLISGTNALCSGLSATLVASGAQTYSWSTGSTNPVITVTPSLATTYSVVGVALNGCSKVTALAINVVPLPTVTAASGAVCPGNFYVISPSGALTYTYSSGSATVFPVSTSNYSISGSNANGCISATPAVVTVSVVNTLTVTVSGNTTLCIGETANLIANGASTYTWSQGSNSNTVALTPTTTTSFTVIGSSGSCSDTTSVAVIVNPLPTLSVSSSASVICLNESTEINVSGASTYSWSTQQSGNIIVVSPTVTTTYTVYGTDANNCSNSAVITQSVSDCIGIPNQTLTETVVRVYPNPTSTNFYVELSSAAELTVSNATGQEILQQGLNAGVNSVEMDDLAKGIYFVRIKQGTQSKSFKIIRQ